MSRTRVIDGDVTIHLHDAGENLSDYIARSNDFFEREVLDYVARVHPVQKTILDVGANIGNHTLYFAKYLEYDSIVAFEPIPANFELLKENTRHLDNVFLRKEAVGNGDSDLTMAENRTNMGASQVDPEGKIRVRQVRLSDIFVPEVSLIKIDVEWHELQVLDGATALIDEDRPLILIEDSAAAYEDYMSTLQYHIEAAWPKERTYLYRRNGI
jgi:FkbM family methyltransferase